MTETYTSWWNVPGHLLTKTALAELEFPRTCDGRKPDAYVEAADWRGRKSTFELFDVHACPPSPATAAQLEAARRRGTKSRTCQDCGAHCQQPLATVGEGPVPARLCPACRHIELLRREQAKLARGRVRIAAAVAAVVADDRPTAVVQVELHEPPRTAQGRRRPATAVRVQAAKLDGTRLLDVAIRLVGPRAQWVPEDAVDQPEGVARVRVVLAGHRVVVWSADELALLRQLDPAGGYPSRRDTDGWLTDWTSEQYGEMGVEARAASAAVEVKTTATQWRGELDPHTRRLVPSVAPGTPDRLALSLRRIAVENGDSVAVSGRVAQQ